MSYYEFGAVMVPVWIAVLALSRCYEARFVGGGSEEFKRVTNATVRLTAVVASVSFVFKLELARGFVAAVLPLGLRPAAAGPLRRAAAAAPRAPAGPLRPPGAGHRLHPRGARPDPPAAAASRSPASRSSAPAWPAAPGAVGSRSARSEVPILGSLSTVPQALAAAGADTVAVASSSAINGEALRRLSYELEGTGIDLLVAPALTSVAGTRVSIRPVAGLPLLHVDEPELAGGRKLAKGVFDRAVAAVALLLLLPLLLALAVAVKLSSRGPVLFRQTRVGRDGKEFRLWKFRSMYADAEERLASLAHLNEHDGLLFKMRQDPRVTPLGRHLRRYSLDELPQLGNVLLGQMSLVGPRPPLPSEVLRYEGHTRRRLLVKPGITGLWQVSGRSTLSWEDSVRLDLHYVENWSLGLDLMVLAKTWPPWSAAPAPTNRQAHPGRRRTCARSSLCPLRTSSRGFTASTSARLAQEKAVGLQDIPPLRVPEGWRYLCQADTSHAPPWRQAHPESGARPHRQLARTTPTQP